MKCVSVSESAYQCAEKCVSVSAKVRISVRNMRISVRVSLW